MRRVVHDPKRPPSDVRNSDSTNAPDRPPAPAQVAPRNSLPTDARGRGLGLETSLYAVPFVREGKPFTSVTKLPRIPAISPTRPSASSHHTKASMDITPRLPDASSEGASGGPTTAASSRSCSECSGRLFNLSDKRCGWCRAMDRVKQLTQREKGKGLGASQSKKTGGVASQSKKTSSVALLSREKNLKQYMSQLRQKGLLTATTAANSVDTTSKRKADRLADAPPSKKLKLAATDSKEYQTAEDLYTSVRRNMVQGKKSSFSGHFCVIQSLDQEATKPRARWEVVKMIAETGLQLRMEIKHPAKMYMEAGQLACRLEYQCGCSQSCQGKLVFKMEKVVTALAPGEKIAVRIRH